MDAFKSATFYFDLPHWFYTSFLLLLSLLINNRSSKWIISLLHIIIIIIIIIIITIIILFLIQSKCLYVLELTVGFQSNFNNNAVHKKEKYLNLIKEMSRNYRCVKFVNLSMSFLGTFSNECSMFLDMMNDIGIDKKQQHYIIRKMINIAIRATYSGFWYFAGSWTCEIQVFPQNSQKNAKYREIRQKYFQIHVGKTYFILILAIRPVLFTPNVQIYLETLSQQRVNNVPKLPGVLDERCEKLGTNHNLNTVVERANYYPS